MQSNGEDYQAVSIDVICVLIRSVLIHHGLLMRSIVRTNHWYRSGLNALRNYGKWTALPYNLYLSDSIVLGFQICCHSLATWPRLRIICSLCDLDLWPLRVSHCLFLLVLLFWITFTFWNNIVHVWVLLVDVNYFFATGPVLSILTLN